MTTFVRRIPAKYDDAYWFVSTGPSGYMERELGAVEASEALRHEKPMGFVDAAGKASGQRSDQGYCFAPYDGLRGLGMPDMEDGDYAEDEDGLGAGEMPMPKRPGGPIMQIGEAPSSESAVARAVPYVVAAVGLLWLFNKTAKETAPPRPAR
jgi:hypothetical protein